MIQISTAGHSVRDEKGPRISKVKAPGNSRLRGNRNKSNDSILRLYTCDDTLIPRGSEEDEDGGMHQTQKGPFASIQHNHKECQRVVINISGLRFMTQLRTLNRYPDTLLGDPARRDRYFDWVKNEYFFDRYRPSFEAILYYYQSGGQLRRSTLVPLDVFCEEIKFFELGEMALVKFKEDQGYVVEKEEPLPANLLQRKIWLIMESAESSQAAKFVAIMSTIVIFVSVATFCLETLPKYKHYTLRYLTNETILVEEYEMPVLTGPFFIIETVCILWFSLELILRFLSCPNKLLLLQDAFIIIDLMSIIPYFVTLATALNQVEEPILSTVQEEPEGSSLAALRGLRLIRVLRIFKLSRRSKGLQVLGKTLRASAKELGLLMFFICIMTVLFSSVLNTVEGRVVEHHFKSIPEGFWWAIVTMTTVGYGDTAPKGFWGKLIGSMCFLAGVLTIALPVPFIEGNFSYFRKQESRKLEMESHCPNHITSCQFSPGLSGAAENNVLNSKNTQAGLPKAL